ncbi:CDP-diacylglycerol--serine O-phosphatidyltransferase [Paracoccus sp. P2]|uniref:CDP-diacylglycerol--serine O-phosphatidyltransferase n=1 Tax=Paracoccus pantotrophus TaxID=82367 RepID=A0A454NHS7_PARPN|nr:CDP-diacylglycerol--serine O-phosphatidyltransferase [Paracoccus pantotrophus]QFG36452.1 CDP-diacylglycerol--serine O-phosphatidyltransferase [Paracoccus pantotrophus]QLH16554.1 CDP-diacylglycerol--serine O-phosphatidyltransferase [Paracoccus pantotrophus]RKS42961.1 CDP-diacylglycerol--serine O-phosphatidyltransferase [Paracoccus pantotrophus]RNI15415.1 CDP-diacylglycerol--serine O-phosphatidyltransferase [Paracoccus pantotrophus]
MDQPSGPQTEFSLVQLLPNMLTIVAVCAGLTAIRFGVQGDYMPAVLLIIAAGILDGIDGRIARLLGSSSKIGAELDSLADFLNFGIAPPLILYFWALKDIRGLGWICVLVFAVCCVIRLARFNVSAKSEEAQRDSAYFEGIPSPAGALLVMLPMYLSFAFADRPMLPGALICLHMVLVGLLLISRIPTWSFKTTRISRENVKFFLVGVAFVGAALLTFAWVTLIALCLGYVVMVIWAWIDRERPSNR